MLIIPKTLYMQSVLFYRRIVLNPPNATFFVKNRHNKST